MGLLDTGFDPQTQGLLAAAFQGLQASGPSRMPMSLGQIIGGAGTAGLGAYGAANKAKLDEQYRLAQIKHMAEQAAIEREKMNKGQVVGPDSALVDPTGKPLYTNPASRSTGTMQERAFGTLAQLHNKARLGVKLTDEEKIQAQMARSILSREESRFDPVTNQQILYKPLSIPKAWTVGLEDDQQGQPASSSALTPGPRLAPTPAGMAVGNEEGRKPLDSADQKILTEQINTPSKQIGDLFNSFKPTFGGFLLDPIANAAIAAGRRLPESVLKKLGQEGLGEQASWWQRYYQWANDVRAAKFGLTLTGNELTAFERSTPKPSDNPEQIQTALQQQMEILANKRRTKIDELAQSGTNKKQIMSAAGPETLAFPTDEEAKNRALEADAKGETVNYKVSIPKGKFNQPKSKQFDIDGKKVLGMLGADGNYYITRGGKRYRIEE